MSIKDMIISRKSERSATDPFTSVANEVDRLFGDLAVGLRWPVDGPTTGMNFMPAVDIESDENIIRISAELPGLEEKDVQVTLSEGVLTLRGEKKFEREQKTKGAYRIERSYGSFERRFALPEDAEAAKAEATFKKGVLTLTLPRREKPKPEVRQVPIRME